MTDIFRLPSEVSKLDMQSVSWANLQRLTTSSGKVSAIRAGDPVF